MKMPRELAACALWVAAICTFGFGIADSVRLHHNSIAMACGLFLAQVALVPTCWCILCRVLDRELTKHDVTLDRIIEVVDTVHSAKRDVRRLH